MLDRLGEAIQKVLGQRSIFGQTILKIGDVQAEAYMVITVLQTN